MDEREYDSDCSSYELEQQDAEGLYNELQKINSSISDNTYSFKNEESVTGQNWLSNAAIISSLKDSKLRQQIEYHKQMVRFLEEELRLRTLGRREYIPYVDRQFSEIESRVPNKEIRLILRNLRPRIRQYRRKHGKMAATILEDTWRKILEIHYDSKE